jgi:UDP-2,4-diacetamido-2,4,6-trideoxy-beta-L-altropyranose hydrolase
VRTDADQTTGLGHLRRCLVLAKQLSRDGFDVRIISRNQEGSVVGRFAGGFPVHWLEDTGILPGAGSNGAEEWDARATLAIAGAYPTGASWVIVDSYDLGPSWERILSRAGHKILALDDLRDRSHYADILVSDSGAPFDVDASSGKPDVRILNALEFALVDSEFDADAHSVERHDERMNLLVSYGGTDETNETRKALEALEIAGRDTTLASRLGHVDVVLGPTNARGASIAKQAKDVPSAAIHHNPESIAPLMRVADIVLSAGGNSMVEAVAMRKPCLVTVTSDNQELMTSRLQRDGLVKVLGRSSAVEPESIIGGVASVIDEYPAFCERLRSRNVIDLLGAARISRVIREVSVSG